jgi:hypothetical protein
METRYAKNFFTSKPWTWRDELVGRDLFRGTVMPTSSICDDIRIRVTWKRVTLDTYGHDTVFGLKIESYYEINQAGKEIFNLQKEIFDLIRSRTEGSLAVWVFGNNECIRQERRLANWLETIPELHEIKKIFLSIFQSTRIPIWEWFYWELGCAIDEHIRGGPDHLYEQFTRYQNQEQKKNVSFWPGRTYKSISKQEVHRGAIAVRDLCWKISKNVYSKDSPNVRNILPALRNRPGDKMYLGSGTWKKASIDQAFSSLDMFRSRRARGILPLSHAWAYCYDDKERLMSALNHLLTERKGLKIRSPEYEDRFYLHAIRRNKPGIYQFGDNLLYISSDLNEKTAFDISMSEVLQGWLRQDGDKNLSWFPHFCSLSRIGGSGDIVTGPWTKSGATILADVYDERPDLFGEEHFMNIPDVIDRTDTFLGIGYPEDKGYSKAPMNVGFKLTVDDVTKRKPVKIRRGSNLPIRMTRTKTDVYRAIATIACYGLHDEVNLEWIYERAYDRDLIFDPEQYLSADGRIEFSVRKTPNLMEEALDVIGERRINELFPDVTYK